MKIAMGFEPNRLPTLIAISYAQCHTVILESFFRTEPCEQKTKRRHRHNPLMLEPLAEQEKLFFFGVGQCVAR